MTATVLVVMGVSGCGKSTIGRLLADRTGWDFLEGDDLHPAANVAKMRAGGPLTDEDRGPWLAAIAAWIAGRVTSDRGGVVACSALRRIYRETLRGADSDSGSTAAAVLFVHLTAPREVLADRLTRRSGHFMPVDLLDSQLATLEPLAPDEPGVTIEATRPVEAQVDQVLATLPL